MSDTDEFAGHGGAYVMVEGKREPEAAARARTEQQKPVDEPAVNRTRPAGRLTTR